jgi:hypothetical protein
VRAVSKKQAAKLRSRRKMVEEMLKDGPIECFVDGCHRPADDPHELLSRGRGGAIDDPDNVRGACRDCHIWITTHPREAELLGYALKRRPT